MSVRDPKGWVCSPQVTTGWSRVKTAGSLGQVCVSVCECACLCAGVHVRWAAGVSSAAGCGVDTGLRGTFPEAWARPQLRGAHPATTDF